MLYVLEVSKSEGSLIPIPPERSTMEYFEIFEPSSDASLGHPKYAEVAAADPLDF